MFYTNLMPSIRRKQPDVTAIGETNALLLKTLHIERCAIFGGVIMGLKSLCNKEVFD